MAALDGNGVLALAGEKSLGYEQVVKMAEELIASFGSRPVLLAIQEDMAKALGQQLALRLGQEAQILCIDRVRLKTGDYLDVGAPVGPALPVVVKTLILKG